MTSPKIFQEIAEAQNGFDGYHLTSGTGLLRSQKDTIQLADDEYLTLGDNSAHSLDGRYFGPIKRNRIVGKAVKIYWPFNRTRLLCE